MEMNEVKYTEETRASGSTRVRRIQVPVCDKTVTHEAGGDFTLPDYQPEIRRLLRITATVGPATRFIGGGAVECSGVVDFNVYYLGADGQLCCAPLESDYRFKVPIEPAAVGDEFDLNDGLVCLCENHAEATASRVLAPRRLTLRCRVRSQVRVLGMKVIAEPEGARGEDLETLTGEVGTVTLLCGAGEPVEVEEEIPLEGVFTEPIPEGEEGAEREARVISADGTVTVSEATPVAGSVDMRGTVSMKVLVGRGNELKMLTREVPFACGVPVDGAESGDAVSAYGSCTDLEIGTDGGVLHCRATLIPEATAQKTGTMSYLRDLYSTVRECRSVTEERVLPAAAWCLNGHFSQSGSAALSDAGLKPDMQIFDVGSAVEVSGAEKMSNGRQALVGTCRVTLIGTDGEETNGGEVEIPFRWEVPGAALPLTAELTGADVTGRVSGIRSRVDGDRVALDCEIWLAVRAFAERRVRMLSEVGFGQPLTADRGTMQVCYPEAGESLWEIAKTYRVPLGTLAEKNDLPLPEDPAAPDTLGDVRFLLF